MDYLKHRALLLYYSCKCFLQCNSCTLYLMSTELKKSSLTLYMYMRINYGHTLNNARVRIVVKYFCLFTAI